MTNEERFRRALERVRDINVPDAATDARHDGLDRRIGLADFAAHVLAGGDPSVDDGYAPTERAGRR